MPTINNATYGAAPTCSALSELRLPVGSTETASKEGESSAHSARLASLPNELLLQILSYVSGHDLANVSRTCSFLHRLSNTASLWAALVSSLRLTVPAPYPSFKALYGALHPHLWLGSRVWHSNQRFIGNLAISHYCAETGKIALHTVVAPAVRCAVKPSASDPSILISFCTPVVEVFTASALQTLPPSPVVADGTELPVVPRMKRAHAIPPHLQAPTMPLWPPPIVPARERAHDPSADGLMDGFEEGAADSIIQLRRELMFAGCTSFSDTELFAAVDAALYTPDAAHPLRGLWIGNYVIHGCEVVLFLQEEAHELVAVKLTGDMNVPRGELTFRVPDLREVTRIGDLGQQWPESRVVPAEGHIAEAHFLRPHFITSEFIWISNDEVAVHWMAPEYFENFHSIIISYRRLDVNRLIFGDGVHNFADQVDKDPN